MKKVFAVIMALALCVSVFAGCGSDTGSSAAGGQSVLDTGDSALDTQEPAGDMDVASDIENGSSEEMAVPSHTIAYPLEGDYTFTIAANPNGLISMVMGEGGFTTSVAYDAMEEATGVHLEWDLYSEATWNEQFNLLMASNDWPDLFDCGVTSRYNGGVAGLLEDDVVVELSKYLDEYAPDYKALLESNEGFRESVVQLDGTVVDFATASSTLEEKGMMIRQDWLDELELEVPTTVDELTDVLKTFKSEYDLSMPLMVYAGLDTGLTYTYNVDRRGFSNSGLGWVVEDGVVKNTFDTEGFREYLELLGSYYAEGLFNDNFVGISDELNTVDSTYLSGQCGVFYAGVSALAESQKANASDPDFRLTALHDIKVNADDPNSGVSESGYTGINSIAISTQCEEPEAAMMFCNYFYTEEGQMLANWGVEGETYTIENGEPQYTDMVLNDEECFMYMMSQTKYSLVWAATNFDVSLMMASYDNVQKAAVEMWTAEREDCLLIPKNATATSEEQEIENQYGSDVATYLWENIFKIVTNQQSVDAFEDVIAAAYEMGLTELTEASQARYDRYVASH